MVITYDIPFHLVVNKTYTQYNKTHGQTICLTIEVTTSCVNICKWSYTRIHNGIMFDQYTDCNCLTYLYVRCKITVHFSCSVPISFSSPTLKTLVPFVCPRTSVGSW